MGAVVKSLAWIFCGICVLIMGTALWGLYEVNRYSNLSPQDRAVEDRAAKLEQETARRERIKGTDCEHLNSVECYKLRTDKRRQEAVLKKLEESGEFDRLREAAEDAGVQ